MLEELPHAVQFLCFLSITSQEKGMNPRSGTNVCCRETSHSPLAICNPGRPASLFPSVLRAMLNRFPPLSNDDVLELTHSTDSHGPA